MSLDELISRFLATCQIRNYSARTVQDYCNVRARLSC